MSITIQQAIQHLSIHLRSDDDCYKQAVAKGYYTAAEGHKRDMEVNQMAIDALREKAEREDPKPLTLEEVWELKAGDVIWHQSLQGPNGCFVVLRHHDIEIFKSELTAARYGKTWLAYRHKPKEVPADG